MGGRLFGTDGVRGLANADLTPELALRLATAAAQVLGAMRPDRARLLTAELARHRSRANDPDGPDNSQDARR